MKKGLLLATALLISYPHLEAHIDPSNLELLGRSVAIPDQLLIEHELVFFKRKRDHDLIYAIDITYGIGDIFGIDISVPIFLTRKQDGKKSGGLGDSFYEFQWNFYLEDANIGLVEVGVKLPTGHPNSSPPTGTGTLDFIAEYNLIHTSPDWYAETNMGAIISTKKKNRKLGNFYFYEFTFGRRFKLKKTSPSTFFATLEMRGFFSERDALAGVFDEDSGGNVIFLGPLFSWARKNLLLQALFQVPIAHHLFGNQKKFDYRANLSMRVAFG